ncbi:MAG TPA: SGNH/GDSL hydrolase family protein [Candidatus Bathyarchaeia archaeon]|nr:SGNH/GDSL hydrolase family protein [Candidatus Bathyarchaeia archaeon]
MKAEPYIVGGRLIPGAYAQLKITLIHPEMLRNDTRKKIFIVGGSAAFGFPYLYSYSFGHLLQKQLGPDQYLVINAAQISFPSGRLVPVVQRIVDYYEPDILIIQTGNNEWTNWRPDDSPWYLVKTIQLFRTLSQSRLLSWILLEAFKHKSARDKQSQELRNKFVIQKEIEGYAYALANPYHQFFNGDAGHLLSSKTAFINTFKDNLTQMINAAQKKNVRVILMNVPFNYKLSPAFMHPQPICFNPSNQKAVDRNLNEIVTLIEKRDYANAVRLVDQTLTLEPYPAILHYLKGYALEKMGNALAAEESYALSRENMVGHLGTRLSINKAIEEVAQKTGVTFVDVKKLFDAEQHTQGGFFNEDLIRDDCHPSPAGHRLIAESLYELIDK